MKDFIVKIYEGVTAFLFVFITVWGGVLGYFYSYGPGGVMFGLIAGFLVAVSITGFIYTLLSINSQLKDVKETLSAKEDSSK